MFNNTVPHRSGLEKYMLWLSTLPAGVRSQSPILYQGAGAWFHMEASTAQPYFDTADTLYLHSYPRPVTLWAGIHATGLNLKEMYQASQGRPVTAAYNHAIEALVSNITISRGHPWEGGPMVIPFFNASLEGMLGCVLH